ncbi:MAG: hypothetical protein WCK92_01150 [Bacteroidota bacterium]
MKSLMKRQDALIRSEARREAFLVKQKEIRKDIEEARAIWKQTLEKLPAQEFKW